MQVTETPPSSSVPVGIPSPTLRVIGAGFGRTGTLSLREALVRLGFAPCDHTLENIDRPERFALWREAFRRKQAREAIDWRPLLGGHRAIVDWPGAYFWRELIAAHPEAKVILTIRDPARWYESSLATIYSMRSRADESAAAGIMLRLVGFVVPAMREVAQTANDVIWQGTFDGRFGDREHAIRVFHEHNREVEDTVPPERLLIFDVKEGWGPLCAFLGVPVPEDEPFPHLNDAESFRQRTQERLVQTALRLAGPAITIGLGLAMLVAIARRRRQGNQGREA